MDVSTIGAIAVLILFLGGMALVMLFVVKLDKRIDKRDRLGKESVYKPKKKEDTK